MTTGPLLGSRVTKNRPGPGLQLRGPGHIALFPHTGKHSNISRSSENHSVSPQKRKGY
jgi:hypothetical protein